MVLIRISVVAVLLALMGAARAGGQTPPVISYQIVARDLDEAAAILELSDAQRAALEPAIEAYQERYRTLAEAAAELGGKVEQAGGIEAFSDSERSGFLREVIGLRGRLSAIDEDLFTAWDAFLTDAQRERLDVVRKLRLRWRCLINLSLSLIHFNVGGAEFGVEIDLRRRLLTLTDVFEPPPGMDRVFSPNLSIAGGQLPGLPAGAMRRVEPILQAYEARLTSQLRAYADAWTKHVWTGEPAVEEVFETGLPILSLQRESMEAIAAELPEESAGPFRADVLMRLYPDVAPDPGRVDRYLPALEAMPLSDEARERVVAIVGAYHQSHRAMSEGLLDMIDEARQDLSFWTLDAEERPAINREILTLLRARSDLNVRTLEEIGAITGAEAMARIAESLPAEWVLVKAETWIRRPTHGMHFHFAGQDDSWRSAGGPGSIFGASLPDGVGPIPEQRLELYARVLHAGDDQRDAMRQLAREVGEPIASAERERLDHFEARRALWQVSERGEAIPAGPELFDEVMGRHEAMVEKALATDQVFFQRLVADVLDDPDPIAVERVRNMHEVWRLSNPFLFYMTVELVGSHRSQRVDLLSAIEMTDLADAEREVLLPICDAYLAQSLTLLREQAEIIFDVQSTGQRLLANRRRFDGEINHFVLDENDPEVDALLRQCLRFRESTAKQAPVNDAFLQAIAGVLKPASLQAVMDHVYALAYPNEVEDYTGVFRFLEAVLDLSDLTAGQRESLREAAIIFRGRDRELTGQMIEQEKLRCTLSTQRFGSQALFFDADGVIRENPKHAEARAAADAKTRLFFQRQDLREQFVRKLGYLLTDVQKQAIGMTGG